MVILCIWRKTRDIWFTSAPEFMRALAGMPADLAFVVITVLGAGFKSSISGFSRCESGTKPLLDYLMVLYLWVWYNTCTLVPELLGSLHPSVISHVNTAASFFHTLTLFSGGKFFELDISDVHMIAPSSTSAPPLFVLFLVVFRTRKRQWAVSMRSASLIASVMYA